MDSSSEKNENHIYYLIEFVKRGRKPAIKSIDIVVKNWISVTTQGKCFVRYPDVSSEDYENLLKNLAPYSLEWKLYCCKIRGRASTLDEAQKKAMLMNEQSTTLTTCTESEFSDAETREINRIRQEQLLNSAKNFKESISLSEGVTSPKSFFPTTSEAHCSTVDLVNELNSTYSAVKPKERKKKHVPTEEADKVLSSMQNKKRKLDSETWRSSKENKIKSTSMAQVDSKFQLILNELKEIKILQNEIAAELKEQGQDIQRFKTMLMTTTTSTSSSTYVSSLSDLGKKYDFDLPFDTMDVFDKFEDQVTKNSNLSNDTKIILQSCIEPTLVITKCLVSMLKLFFTKNLALQFVAVKSVKGKKVLKKKTKFYLLAEGIIKERRLQCNLPITDKEFNVALSSVMTNVPSWRSRTTSDPVGKSNKSDGQMQEKNASTYQELDAAYLNSNEETSEELIGEFELFPLNDNFEIVFDAEEQR